MPRLSANVLARSDTVLVVEQLNDGRGASTSARSRAATSTKLATIAEFIPSGNKSGNTSVIFPLRTARISAIRASLEEYRNLRLSTRCAMVSILTAISFLFVTGHLVLVYIYSKSIIELLSSSPSIFNVGLIYISIINYFTCS